MKLLALSQIHMIQNHTFVQSIQNASSTARYSKWVTDSHTVLSINISMEHQTALVHRTH